MSYSHRSEEVQELVEDLRIKADRVTRIKGLIPGMYRLELIVDVSPSMKDLFLKVLENQYTVMELLIMRLVGLGLVLDDNAIIPCRAFDKGVFYHGKFTHKTIYYPDLRDPTGRSRIESHTVELPPVTTDNIEMYVQRYLKPLASISDMTNYAPVLEHLYDSLIPGPPILVLFFTDGENQDEVAARRILQLSSSSPLFIQFFGIGEKKPSPDDFLFLKSVNNLEGCYVDHVGFATLDVSMESDDEFYAAMLNEFPDYLQKPKTQALLPWTKLYPRYYDGWTPNARKGFLDRLFGR